MNNELREKIYSMSNSFLPLDTFYNDIDLNSAENYDKESAFKDLEIIANFILDLQKQLAEKDKEIEHLNRVILNWQARNKQLSVEKTKAIIDYDNLVRNVNKFADNQLAIQELKKVLDYIKEHRHTAQDDRYIVYVKSLKDQINKQIKELKTE